MIDWLNNELVFVYFIDWLIDKWNSLFLIIMNVLFV